MKKPSPFRLAVACLAVASQLISCTYGPVRTDEPGTDMFYDSSRYRLDEIIVMFKSPPTKASIDSIKTKIHKSGIDSATIAPPRRCNSCNGYVELWHADSLHSRIHADGIRAGSSSDRGSNGVGQDGFAHYSLNFNQNIPMDFAGEGFRGYKFRNFKKLENNIGEKQVVRIAVLDTGIDTTRIIGASYLWTNRVELPNKENGVDEDNNCYNDDIYGWNFLGKGDNKVMDDNPNLHGTLVSHYIINEFANLQTKAVELMALKTHDKNGYGDLFSSICAIHYAMEKGAQIINASWGFYYYHANPHPYLDSLITQVLRKKGILFVTAAGNKIEERDNFARKVYHDAHNVDISDSDLRNLECHNFYPACLSRENNNVITVTTADKNRVSPNQNYSSMYVDLGAIPDDHGEMRFQVRFDPETSVSGSSFAAAIVSGRIGAFLQNTAYTLDISKSVVLGPMEAAGLSTTSPTLESIHIRGGRITPHR